VHTFKVGEKVKIIKLGKLGVEDSDWLKKANLTINRIVTIKYSNGDNWVRLEEGSEYWHYYAHFEKIKKNRTAKKVKVSKQIRTVTNINLRRG